ncbi:endochitinase class V precursor [Akanthomyces lecanii RCEF 1005]|uniref:chitinase n=1 Tax=Akanthomyces lecanii RCEF 1005 TaxID=1081108 RepID=A0A168IM49_CORDF|nr:endochitinase class V precursor [Akanthomyces lecanii RCEF 1005]
MLQLPVLLPLLALAVRGAPTGNTDGGGACSVVLVPVLVPVDTTVAAPNPTNSVESPITGGRAGAVNSVGRENKMVMFAQGASSTKPDTAAAAQSASTTMDRPSKVTSAAVRTASSNKLSPTGTSTTTLTTTVTVSGKESSYTPGTDQDDGVEVQGRKNVVYFTNWSEHGGNYTPAEIPAQDVTHLLYAFGDISSTGEVISSDSQADIHRQYGGTQRRSSQAQGNIGQIYNIKQQNRNMKALLSIGGASYSASGKFAPATSTVDGRQRFARSAVKLITNWGFDGIDIDWEYPETESEAADFVSLLQETRYELNKYAKDNNQTYHYLLTVAASAGPSHYRLLNLGAMDRYVDSWHLMAYDYAGAWDSTTGHQANVYPDLSNAASTKFNTEQAVDDYIAAGIEPDKIILGFPLYGRSFAQTSGLGKPFSGVGQGSIEPGVWLYKDLPRPGAAVTVDHTVLAAYSYDAAARSLISYDNEESARLKANYLLKKGLGGAVFWEASGDKPGEDSLVASLARSMWPLQSSQNMLEYPDSEFENIRMGF